MHGYFQRLFIAWLLVAAALCNAIAAEPALRVAAAADLAPCIDELNRAFARHVGKARVEASIGASGNLHAQILHGAPFDVFLSADMEYPRALAKAGAADAASLIVYAHGRLLLWSANPALDTALGFSLLRDARVKRIAIANPDSAPYGRAAKAALESAGLWQELQPKLVRGESVAQTAQFVETAHAQVGFVSATHVANVGKAGSGTNAWQVPVASYPLLEQGAIMTNKGRANPIAARYLAFLRSDAARAILLAYGFTLPGKAD